MTPAEAREYIKQFTTHTMPGVTFVRFSSGREVQLANMRDDDAVLIAQQFMAMETEAVRNATRN